MLSIVLVTACCLLPFLGIASISLGVTSRLVWPSSYTIGSLFGVLVAISAILFYRFRVRTFRGEWQG